MLDTLDKVLVFDIQSYLVTVDRTTYRILTNLKPGDYKDSQTNRTYVVNKVTEHRTTAPGKIKRLSVAVFVDTKIDSAQQHALRNTLAASVGLDLTPSSAGGRGDKIELMPFAFDTTAQDTDKKETLAASKEAAQTNLVRNGAALGMLLLVGIFTLLMTRRTSRKPQRPRLDATIGGDEAPALESRSPSSAAVGGSLDPRNLIAGGHELGGEETLDTALERLQRAAADQPEEVALMLQDWLRGPSPPPR